MIEIIGGLWAAGETKTFVINGEYLEILEAQYPCDVMLMDKSGAQLSIMRSSEASFFSRPKEGFQTVQIASAQAQSIRVFIGSGDAGTRRISSTVAIIDGERTKALAGMAFYACPYQAAGAANYSHVQLWNPVGSGRRVIIPQAGFSSSGAASIISSIYTAPLTTDASANSLSSRLSGGAAGVAQVRKQLSVGVIVGPSQMFGAAMPITFQPRGAPVILLPGYGLTACPSAVNVDLNATFEFTEEII